MADDDNAPVAAGGDTTPALSVDDAVATLDQEDVKQAEPKEEAPAKGKADTDAPADEPAEEAEPSNEDETPASDEDAEPETEEAPDEIVHGNAKTRLRDGTVVAVADLKKAFDELQEFKRQGPDISKQREEVEQVKAKVQQQQKYLEEVLPHAIGVLERTIPPEPPLSLRDSDPIEYFMQKDQRETALAEFRSIDNARQLALAEQQKAQQAEFQKYIQTERDRLLDVKPELKDPEKAKAFHTDFVRVGKKYGFSDDEINGVHDHRLIVALVEADGKATKWDKLHAPDTKKQVAEKTKDTIPVQQPGRRVQPAERRSTQVEEHWKRLGTSGSIDDAVAVLNASNIS